MKIYSLLNTKNTLTPCGSLFRCFQKEFNTSWLHVPFDNNDNHRLAIFPGTDSRVSGAFFLVLVPGIISSASGGAAETSPACAEPTMAAHGSTAGSKDVKVVLRK